MRRLVALALVLYAGRWAARVAAAQIARRWLPVGPPATESPRQPGRMPGPFD